jgi:hypothetical protein
MTNHPFTNLVIKSRDGNSGTTELLAEEGHWILKALQKLESYFKIATTLKTNLKLLALGILYFS